MAGGQTGTLGQLTDVSCPRHVKAQTDGWDNTIAGGLLKCLRGRKGKGQCFSAGGRGKGRVAGALPPPPDGGRAVREGGAKHRDGQTFGQ